ncbi:hypothetical protein Nmel_006995 [Mimus melanotis]
MGTPQICRVQPILEQCPTCQGTLALKGQKITLINLINTEVDVTVISQAKWPPQWSLAEVLRALSGIGGSFCSYQSCHLIHFKDEQQYSRVFLFSYSRRTEFCTMARTHFFTSSPQLPAKGGKLQSWITCLARSHARPPTALLEPIQQLSMPEGYYAKGIHSGKSIHTIVLCIGSILLHSSLGMLAATAAGYTNISEHDRLPQQKHNSKQYNEKQTRKTQTNSARPNLESIEKTAHQEKNENILIPRQLHCEMATLPLKRLHSYTMQQIMIEEKVNFEGPFNLLLDSSTNKHKLSQDA